MFTSKERSKLRSLASVEDTIMQIGKNGINENLVKSLSDALDKRELIKISVLKMRNRTKIAFPFRWRRRCPPRSLRSSGERLSSTAGRRKRA